jgi:hypothetical protein
VKTDDCNAPASGWDTNWYSSCSLIVAWFDVIVIVRNDSQRAAWQRSKLATKDLSAASHLKLLALHTRNSSKPCVRHLNLSHPGQPHEISIEVTMHDKADTL